jgi:hypothetical protein
MRFSQEAADLAVKRSCLLRSKEFGSKFGDGKIPIAGVSLG